MPWITKTSSIPQRESFHLDSEGDPMRPIWVSLFHQWGTSCCLQYSATIAESKRAARHFPPIQLKDVTGWGAVRYCHHTRRPSACPRILERELESRPY